MQGYRGSTVLLNNVILFYITDIVIKYYYGGSLSSHFDWASVSCCDDSSRLAGVSPQELFQFVMHFIVSHFPTLISIMAVSLFPDLINSIAQKEPINKVRQTFLTRI